MLARCRREFSPEARATLATLTGIGYRRLLPLHGGEGRVPLHEILAIVDCRAKSDLSRCRCSSLAPALVLERRRPSLARDGGRNRHSRSTSSRRHRHSTQPAIRTTRRMGSRSPRSRPGSPKWPAETIETALAPRWLWPPGLALLALRFARSARIETCPRIGAVIAAFALTWSTHDRDLRRERREAVASDQAVRGPSPCPPSWVDQTSPDGNRNCPSLRE